MDLDSILPELDGDWQVRVRRDLKSSPPVLHLKSSTRANLSIFLHTEEMGTCLFCNTFLWSKNNHEMIYYHIRYEGKLLPNLGTQIPSSSH